MGSDGPPDPEKVHAKVQNPTPVEDRLTNPKVAEEALHRLSTPDLGRMFSYEPDRGPGLKFFRVGRTVPLIYMPIRGAWVDPVPDWLKAIDPDNEVETGMTQKDLRRWKRLHPGHRSFTVLRHPLSRVYDAFCRFILPLNIETYAEIRDALMTQYGLPLPEVFPDDLYDLDRHRAAFLAFLNFLAGNLGGQTSLRVDSTWATQNALVHAIGQFVVPDRIIREEQLADELPQIAREIGYPSPSFKLDRTTIGPFSLADVYSPEIEKACETAYRRDYVMFGFNAWKPDG